MMRPKVEAIHNLFAVLFLAIIGMLIHVHFLWNHAAILLASVILVVIVKTVLVAMVIKAFGYITRTSFLVAVSLAQIGEFAFVLLSCASNLHLIEDKATMLEAYNGALYYQFLISHSIGAFIVQLSSLHSNTRNFNHIQGNSFIDG
uniref:K(+) efflux antiporter 4 isoform X2 n=1 Tax=Elaeis guineensis var. tenera TaxID=51953 RepID=A0A6I9RX57_ELAGV|nr:K(+) efflux antiporter 4 isoform X2 [Elaeis guineensis]